MELALLELSMVALLGVIIGSFLNVVIIRLPIMLERQWLIDNGQLADADKSAPAQRPYNLAWPPSHCLNCQQPLRWFQNIPLLSYLWLRGKSACCQTTIAIQYPLVELTAAAIALLSWHWFGLSLQGLMCMLLFCSLLCLSLIDVRHMLLPDQLTLPLLWAGLLATLWLSPLSLADSVLGAAAGYLSLWSIYWLFRLTTGKEGMGYGDFKLLAALGAWFGWQALPFIILSASISGVAIGLIYFVIRKHSAPVPFGPFLSAGALLYLAIQQAGLLPQALAGVFS